MPGELFGAFRIGEPDMADHGVGKAVLRIDLVQPGGLFDLLVAVVFRFDMHRLHDAEGLRVAPVIFRQVAAPDPQIVAEDFAALGLVGQPGIIVAFEVPQMMVGVDDVQILQRCHVSHELDSAREPNSRRTNTMIDAPTRSCRIDNPASSEKTPVLQVSNASTEKVRVFAV